MFTLEYHNRHYLGLEWEVLSDYLETVCLYELVHSIQQISKACYFEATVYHLKSFSYFYR